MDEDDDDIGVGGVGSGGDGDDGGSQYCEGEERRRENNKTY